MSARAPASGNDNWVDVQRGLVSRDIFVSDEVWRLEMERIFDRTWIFLAHETEIPAPGDFVSRSLGSAPVVIVRDSDGTMHALLNTLPASRSQDLSCGFRQRSQFRLPVSRLDLRAVRPADHDDVRSAPSEGLRFFPAWTSRAFLASRSTRD